MVNRAHNTVAAARKAWADYTERCWNEGQPATYQDFEKWLVKNVPQAVIREWWNIVKREDRERDKK